MEISALIGGILAACATLAGFIGWLSKVSADVGYIRRQFDETVELAHQNRLRLDQHHERISRLERTRPDA